MQITIKIISTLLIATMALSCGQQEEHEHEHDHSGSEAIEEHDHDHETLKKNIKRWQANPETTLGIANMVEKMEAMSDKEREDVESYNALGKSLQAEFNMIFEKCTMTGEAHEQLHTYLLPMKGSFDNLSSNDLDTCKEGYEHLRMHLETYSKYFTP